MHSLFLPGGILLCSIVVDLSCILILDCNCLNYWKNDCLVKFYI